MLKWTCDHTLFFALINPVIMYIIGRVPAVKCLILMATDLDLDVQFSTNNPTCVNEIGRYSCRCAPGFTGQFCDVNINDVVDV